MEQQEPKTLLECPLKVILPGQDSAQGQEAEARLTETGLELTAKFLDALTYSYRDIVGIEAENYRVNLSVVNGDTLHLYHLGSKYSDFVRILIYQRNELILTDLLMQERVRRAEIEAACTRHVPGEEPKELGTCELRVCDTALLIIPEYAEPVRLPFSFVDNVAAEGYSVTIASDYGEKYTFAKLGREFTPFTDLLSEVIGELSAKAQQLLREFAPAAAPTAIHQAARLMREGRAARRQDLDEIDPGLWKGLEQHLEAVGVSEEYTFLSAMAGTSQQCLGFKRELAAQADTEYIWFLIPIPKSNILAMEASAGPESGRATYFFRITGRAEYSAAKPQELQARINQLLVDINRFMLASNFRREPVYLPAEKLREPRYHKYLFAVQKVPGLMELRNLFVGRVFHRDPEQWQDDVKDLLRFNVSTTEDKKKWTKSDFETPEFEDQDSELGG